MDGSNHRHRNTRARAALIALLALSCCGVLAGAAQAAIPANYLTVVDQGGANDVNASQVDLTQFGRDDSDASTYKLLWSWDATDDWTGAGQTGDACALFDTDGDGDVNFVVCAQIENPGADASVVTQVAGSPYAFSCSDAKNDRCTNPTPVTITAGSVVSGAINELTGAIAPSPPASLITATDPFPNLNPDQNWPNDSTIAIDIAKSFLPADATLVNVCTYPSAGNGGNNNPFDCIINPGDGLLVIKKVAPAGTTQVFSFTVQPGDIAKQITGSGQTDEFGMPAGDSTSVSETVPADWVLDSASCVLEDGTTSTGTKSGSTISGITIQTGLVTTCTFTNSPIPGKVGLTKVADAASVSAGDPIGFTLTVANTGAGPAHGVGLTDTLPATAGLSWSESPDNPDCSIASGVLTCDFGTLAAGASRSVHVTSPTTSASCTTINNTGNTTSTDSGSDSDSDFVDVHCAAIDVLKAADAASVSAGDQLGFTVTLSNNGDGEAKGLVFSDPLPAGLSWSISPASAGWSISNGNLVYSPTTLAAGASTTVHVVATTDQADCGLVENTASVTTSNDGSDSSSASVDVNCAAIDIEKTGPDRATVGDALHYTLTVTDPGDTSFPAQQVIVTDPKCEAPPAGPNTGSDATPGTLDPGDTWTYTCTAQTAGQPAGTFVNTAHVAGRDTEGREATDTDDFPTILQAQAVLPQTIVNGTARLRGPSGCVKGPFKATVRGSRIARVTFFVDGKRFKRITAPTGEGSKFTVSISPKRRGFGVHRVTARVEFVAASQTKTRTLRLSFQRCKKQVVRPRFTG
jgi:uncharacterized repeat protein (TIGR01451 family)